MLRRLVFPSVAALIAAGGLYVAGDTPAAASGGPAGQEAFTPREVTAADIPPDIREDSWARLPTVRRETLDAEGRRVFDIIVNPESRYASGLRGPIGMWMYSPPMAEHLFPASTYLRFGADGARDQRLAELAILTAARSLDSQYEWSAHEGLGRQAGLEDGIIDLLRHDRPVADGFGLRPVLLHPESRGAVRLRSADPTEKVRIVQNFLQTEDDLVTLRDGFKLARELMNQSALDEFRGEEISPGKEVDTDDRIDDWIRRTAVTAHHPSCTAPMGTGEAAALDAECKVRGAEALRVVDASSMPDLVSGNINAAVLAIAEKASDHILGKTPLPRAETL